MVFFKASPFLSSGVFLKSRDRKPFKGGLSMNEVRARNEAYDNKLKKMGPVKRYSLLKSMGFSGGKMIKAKGGKEIVGKKTKLF